MNLETLLNEKQYLACTSNAKHLRIIAGAGTGKTRTITYRLAYLISNGMFPSKILGITFTRKAANEMKERVISLLKENEIPYSTEPLLTTFHGYCYRFLRKEILRLKIYDENFQIADDSDTNQILKDVFKTMTKGENKDFIKAITNKISSLKNNGKRSSDISESDIPLDAIYTFNELLYAFSNYEKYLIRQNLLDYDDLLLYTLLILENFPDAREYYSNKYSMIFVDEFQDTNDVQYQLMKYLVGNNTYLTVVGDPDQTIYTWRGAKNEIIKSNLQYDYPDLETIVLDDNYRSTQSILDLSNKLINNNPNRMKKDLNAASKIEGEKPTYKPCPDESMEGYYIAKTINDLVLNKGYSYSDIAILYRLNYVSRSIEKGLAMFKIPYVIYGGVKFFDRLEIKDSLAYLKIFFTHDDLSMKRILKLPSKGIGEVTLSKITEYEAKQELGQDNIFTILKDHRDEFRLSSNTKLALDHFYEIYNKYENQFLNPNIDKNDLISLIHSYFEDVGLFKAYKEIDIKEGEDKRFTDKSSSSRIDNINELFNELVYYVNSTNLDEDGKEIHPSLSDFLINLALQTSQDELKDDNKVKLMTIHISKGLEFKVVFIASLNDGISPSYRALQESSIAMEEERRLLYVAMTRAQEKLYLTNKGGFDYFHSREPFRPSRFLKEIGFLTSIYSTDNQNKNTFSRKESYESHVGKNRASFNPEINNTPINKSNVTYKVGDEVIHTSFGKGKIINVEIRKDSSQLLTIIFNEIEGNINVSKKLIPNYLCLKKLGE